jgi:transposase
MATIIKKKVRNHTYYYAVESKRVDGKPRIVWQQYLGKLEDITRRASQKPATPVAAKVFDFGAAAAYFHIAKQIGLVELIDQHAPKRKQGATVGQYMLIAAINRALHPVSKSEMADWFSGTCLPKWTGVPNKQLTSQRFWDHMDRLDEQTINAIEESLTRRLVEQFQLDLRCLLYDATNFYTYISSSSEESLPQYGHNKAKRTDLKQVSLALMVSSDFHIPLLHQVYPGNRNDSDQFSKIISSLAERYQSITSSCDKVTLVFDKGNNSKANVPSLQQTPFHFVGSLTPSYQADLLEIPMDQFITLSEPRLGGVSSHRVRKEVFGAKRTVVITYSEDLYLANMKNSIAQRYKANDDLQKLQVHAAKSCDTSKRGRKISKESIEKEVMSILKGRGLKSNWLQYRIEEQAEGGFILTYNWDQTAIEEHQKKVFGKTILFTDHETWSDAEIILAYRGQAKIEEAFRKMKDTEFLCWDPRYHWTDQKIRVHAFYCVLALTLTSLLQRQLAQQGLALSAAKMIHTLAGIQEVVNIYPEASGIKPQVVLTSLTELQSQMFEKLELGQYRMLS